MNQIQMMSIAYIEDSVVDNHPGGWAMPIDRRIPLIGPLFGLNSSIHTNATATPLVM
ncbi:hypothetical protein D3C76_1455870 [compost metagenome]